MFVSVVQCEGKIVVERKIENRKIGAEEKKNRKEKKKCFPHRESNPGHGGESAGS